jgi:hypothetical protein
MMQMSGQICERSVAFRANKEANCDTAFLMRQRCSPFTLLSKNALMNA